MELKRDLEMVGEKCHMGLTSTSIPHVFYGIQEGVNNKLYMREFNFNRTLEIESGNYTASSLANKLSQKLNANAGTDIAYTVTYSATTMKISIVQSGSNAQGIRIYTDKEIKDGRLGELPVANPASLQQSACP